MYVKLIGEIGYDQAVFGDGLSFGKTSSIEFEDFLKGEFEELVVSCGNRTSKLSKMERGHDGALKMIQTWWDIRAPRYWWVEMDTYGVGKAQRSESTMHMLKRQKLTPADFERGIDHEYLAKINNKIKAGLPIDVIKNALPEGFLQRRIVNLNYMGLKNIIMQRKGHLLPEWRLFIESVRNQVEHPELLP